MIACYEGDWLDGRYMGKHKGFALDEETARNFLAGVTVDLYEVYPTQYLRELN